ncbi:MAG TPA: anti-sigma factor [Flavitalea sp.]|nr:anti-sigma factor [Flavitalea sp.]
MNIQEYISSGIVEAYVLGLASKEEMAEFDNLCAAHSEVRAARDQFELSLEAAALGSAVQPDKSLKSKIFAEIEIESYDQQNAAAEQQAPVVEMDAAPAYSTSFRKYMNVAAVILLAGSIAMNLYFFSQYKSYSNKYNQLLAQQTDMAANNKSLQATLKQYEESVSLMKDPDMLVVKMPGSNVATSPASNSMATVYYNTKSNQVYLVVNRLPVAAPDKQYQLWAIVDGKPVDAGVFTPGKEPMFTMKNISRAQAFAITLEKPGGSTAPEGPMYVLGKV